jgi:broad specificity phosphatase PhoE
MVTDDWAAFRAKRSRGWLLARRALSSAPVSSLFLIRHGQAVYPAAGEPALSELGVRQAGLLGRWVGQTGLRLDAVYSGPRLRQMETARHLLAAARTDGGPLPAAQVLAELDEFPAEHILRAWLASAPEAPRRWEPPTDASLDARARWKLIAPFLSQATEAWRRGELEVAESFTGFAERVRAGLGRIQSLEGRGRRVAVVTSAGPVSMAVRCALRLDDAATLRLLWVVNHTSVTELRYRDEELSMAGFNAVPHLPPDLVT